ncbi:hypothetical protein SUGI_0828620 [Cryptomeria japonica]|nr:hypothetical protein SUGI_0828620 [Cryptomeria japonica]
MTTSRKLGVLNIEEKKEAMTAGMLFTSVPMTAAMAQPATTRWNPTPEQLMILEDMYRGGIRTPNAEEIQQITAHLSLYGKIEGKNVFYWFQNHKARDRQKLRRKMETKQQEPKSSKTLAGETGLGLDLNHGWIYSSHESIQDQFHSSVQEYGYDYEYGEEMENRCASVRPLKTLELFPTCSGL